jgi:hypothetical protein
MQGCLITRILSNCTNFFASKVQNPKVSDTTGDAMKY